MRILIEIDADHDVAYIPMATHDPLRRVWRCIPVDQDLVLDIDPHGDLVGLELLHARKCLERLGVRAPLELT